MTFLINEPRTPAQACVIWMHGLGAEASDMAGLAQQLKLPDLALRHVFASAPMRPVTLNQGMMMPAWYDILGLELVDRQDKEGIEQSRGEIKKIIEEQRLEGFNWEQIFLAGFSQGGAMALHVALSIPARLAGVIALSAYLPLMEHTQPMLDRSTPIFMGSGSLDPLVLPQWNKMSQDWLLKQNYTHISSHQYVMEHSVCMQEILDLSSWLVHHTPRRNI